MVESAGKNSCNWPMTVNSARINSAVVEAKNETELMILPDRMASSGVSRREAWVTQLKRCSFISADREGRLRSNMDEAKP